MSHPRSYDEGGDPGRVSRGVRVEQVLEQVEEERPVEAEEVLGCDTSEEKVLELEGPVSVPCLPSIPTHQTESRSHWVQESKWTR